MEKKSEEKIVIMMKNGETNEKNLKKLLKKIKKGQKWKKI